MGELQLYWMGDLELLKQFVNKNIELTNGAWSSPGGDKKTYSDGHTSISWRRSKKILQVEGKDENLIKARLCSAICNANFVSSGERTRVIVNGQQVTSPTALDVDDPSTEMDSDRSGAVIASEVPRPGDDLCSATTESCLGEMGEISVEVGEQLDNRSDEIMSATSPGLFLNKSALSFEYQKSQTSHETNTFVSKIPLKTITNSNYSNKVCQTMVDEFNHALNSHNNNAHQCICQQGYTAIETIKSKISEVQSSVDAFETSLGDLDSILFSYNKAADLNEKYLVEITEYKNRISCLEQQLTIVKDERDSFQLAMNLVAQESNYCDGNKILPNQNLLRERQSAHTGNKNSFQTYNNAARAKRNRLELQIDEANHVENSHHDFELYAKPEIEIIKLDDSCDGSKPTSSRQSIYKRAEKSQKNEVPCPFIKKRGFCLKGATCDFLHPPNSQSSPPGKRVPPFVPNQPFTPKHNVRKDVAPPFLFPSPFLCPPYFPPPFLHQPFLQQYIPPRMLQTRPPPLMSVPTRPPTHLVRQTMY